MSGAGSGLTVRSSGLAIGTESHVLSTDEIPAHDHANGAYNKLLRVTGTNSAANLDNSPGEPDVVSTGTWEVKVFCIGLNWLRFENGMANHIFSD
jgi:hypothetical protein